MKLLVLVLSTIVVFGCLVHGTSGEDVETIETPAVAEDAEIEEKVAQIMDETELPGLVNEDDAQEKGDGESSDNCVKEQIEVSSGNDGTEVELIEEAKENKFTFMCLFHGKNYERYYQKINNHLVDKLGEDDNTERNMREALNWIAELEKSTFKDRNLIRALKQLTSLTKIGGDNMCTKNAYGILRKNDLATRGRAHKRRTKLGAMSRVEKMVYEYSIQHAIDCFREYPRKFAIKRSQLDPVQLNRVEPLINQIFRTVLKPKFLGIFAIDAVRENIDPTELVRDIKYLDKADIAEVVLKQLVSYAKDDPDKKYLDYVNDDRTAKFIIREDKIKDLFEKYIVSPCEYYIKQLGFDILIPMRFDVQMLESEDRYLLNNDQVTDFFIGYANFRACNLIVYQDRKALARRLVKAAQKKNKPED